MAEVNHWYRAHHGTVSDPKFALVAIKAGERRGDVIAVWHHLLEEASASADRGNPGTPDFEVLDLMLGMSEGGAARIYGALITRGMIDGENGRIVQWDKRQPKREREEEPGAAAERKRRQRARERGADEDGGQEFDAEDSGGTTVVTPSHATSHHVTPIGEERRGEEIKATPNGVAGEEARASVAAAVEIDEGLPPCPHQAIIEAFHRALPTARQVRDWTPARAAALRTRWREKRKRQSVEWWAEFFAYCARSKFLTGRTEPGRGRKPFELSLDWLVKAENFAKTVEGAYHVDADPVPESEELAA